MPKKWDVLSSKASGNYKVFSVRTDRARSPRTGREHDFYVLDSPDWVNVIALTPAQEVLMVRQYRHGIREVTLELPGGLVEPGKTPLEAARRELLEETGYRAGEWKLLGSGYPQPAILSNRCFAYLANGVEKAGELEQEETEDIEVVRVPLTQIPELIRQGEICHALVVAAFYRLEILFPGQ